MPPDPPQREGPYSPFYEHIRLSHHRQSLVEKVIATLIYDTWLRRSEYFIPENIIASELTFYCINH